MNIVFDLGGVVFEWRPNEIVRAVFEDPETQALAKAEIFGHPDWIELDRGTLALDQAIIRGARRTGLPGEDVERLLREVPRSLTPVPGTTDLIRDIAVTDNSLFVLSNMQFASIAHIEKRYDIWDLFDGIVISCRIKKVKPEIAIYEHLLSEYKLVASETIFIDDMSENLAAARTIGIHTVKFTSANQCRQDLVELNCV